MTSLTSIPTNLTAIHWTDCIAEEFNTAGLIQNGRLEALITCIGNLQKEPVKSLDASRLMHYVLNQVADKQLNLKGIDRTVKAVFLALKQVLQTNLLKKPLCKLIKDYPLNLRNGIFYLSGPQLALLVEQSDYFKTLWNQEDNFSERHPLDIKIEEFCLLLEALTFPYVKREFSLAEIVDIFTLAEHFELLKLRAFILQNCIHPGLQKLTLEDSIEWNERIRHIQSKKNQFLLDLFLGTLQGLVQKNVQDAQSFMANRPLLNRLVNPLSLITRLTFHTLDNKTLSAISDLFPSVRILAIYNSQLRESGLIHLNKLEHLVSLDLSVPEEIEQGFLYHLQKNRYLEKLHLRGYSGLQKANLRGISSLKNLQILRLTFVYLEEQDFEEISQCRHLKQLKLTRVEVSNPLILQSICSLSYLELDARLSFRLKDVSDFKQQVKNYDDIILRELLEKISQERLDNPEDGVEIKGIAQTMKDLEVLSLTTLNLS
ncbi:MAG: hypothetical protein K0S74_1566 [Chlamydiales bacterium]|jgi:hypothetical protein|nr:hypothetical protein [Chlamydiales bacterium]